MNERFRFVDAATLAAELGSAAPPRLVDVREPAAFELGHIPRSLHVPVHDLGARRGELPSSLAAPLVLVGDDRRRTLAAARFLEIAGFGDVRVLEGGIAAWDGALESGAPAPRTRPGPQLRDLP